MKTLNSGGVPKRGNPNKEEKDETDKELENMMKEGEKKESIIFY